MNPFGLFLVVIPIYSRTAARLAQMYFVEAVGLFRQSLAERNPPIEIVEPTFIGTVKTFEDLELAISSLAVRYGLNEKEGEP